MRAVVTIFLLALVPALAGTVRAQDAAEAPRFGLTPFIGFSTGYVLSGTLSHPNVGSVPLMQMSDGGLSFGGEMSVRITRHLGLRAGVTRSGGGDAAERTNTWLGRAVVALRPLADLPLVLTAGAGGIRPPPLLSNVDRRTNHGAVVLGLEVDDRQTSLADNLGVRLAVDDYLIQWREKAMAEPLADVMGSPPDLELDRSNLLVMRIGLTVLF